MVLVEQVGDLVVVKVVGVIALAVRVEVQVVSLGVAARELRVIVVAIKGAIMYVAMGVQVRTKIILFLVSWVVVELMVLVEQVGDLVLV